MKSKLRQVLAWLDDHILLMLSLFLLLFIPLWPKLPLADLIPGYIVRLRLEDLLVFGTFIIYLIWVWRGKIIWRMPTWKLIFAYLAIGAMSILSAMFIIQTIPLSFVHVAKAVLHWARYIEYFFLAFLFFSSFKTKKDFSLAAGAILLAVAGVSIYGIGQKYFYWPLYSTMNREFSKGIKLYLTPHARVQSTFGGHYDFAAYLVLMLPITLLLAWQAPKRWQRLTAWAVHILGLWSIVASAARTSILAYFGSVLILFLIYYFGQNQYRPWRRLWRLFSRGLLYVCLVSVIIVNFGQDMIERFTQSINSVEFLKTNYYRLQEFREDTATFLGLDKLQPPANSVAVVIDEYGNNTVVSNVLTPTDSQPVATRPADVYIDVPEIKYTTNEAGETIAYESVRTWSVNAEKYGLSMAIRFDTLWPNAWRGFLRNPLLGSGYGTLNKGELLDTFTEADSIDNNYLRVLGETGALGFITFYSIIILALKQAISSLKRHQSSASLIINLGFLISASGMLINALLIDVFAASKVAFTFWSLVGLFWAGQNVFYAKKTQK